MKQAKNKKVSAKKRPAISKPALKPYFALLQISKFADLFVEISVPFMNMKFPFPKVPDAENAMGAILIYDSQEAFEKDNPGKEPFIFWSQVK